MHIVYALLCLAGYFVAIGATLAAWLLSERPRVLRDHVLQLSRLGLISGCAFSIARLLWPLNLNATFEQALLAVSLAVVMVLRADSEVKRQRGQCSSGSTA